MPVYWFELLYAYRNLQIESLFKTFYLIEWVCALWANGKPTNFNQQKFEVMAHSTIEISVYIPTIEHFRKIIEVC